MQKSTNETTQNRPSVAKLKMGEKYIGKELTATPVLDRKSIVAKSVCFNTQVDGTHYTDLQLQPLEATYLRYGLEGLKAAIHTKVEKYISREKDNAVVQLKKAQHCLQILTEITELENANSSS